MWHPAREMTSFAFWDTTLTGGYEIKAQYLEQGECE